MKVRPIPADQRIREAGFFSPPSLAFVPRDYAALLLKPAPVDSPVDLVDGRVDLRSFGLRISGAHNEPLFPLPSGSSFGILHKEELHSAKGANGIPLVQTLSLGLSFQIVMNGTRVGRSCFFNVHLIQKLNRRSPKLLISMKPVGHDTLSATRQIVQITM